MPYLLYIHGFNSSDKSEKANVLKSYAEPLGLASCILFPCLSWQPKKAIAQLESLIETHLEEGISLIGSSLGGFYASYLAEKYGIKAILVNPAVQAPQLLTAHLGQQYNPYTGEEYVLAQEQMVELQALVVVQPSASLYWLMVQEGDETLDYRAALEQFQNVARLTHEKGGNHRFVDFENHAKDIFEYANLLPAAHS